MMSRGNSISAIQKLVASPLNQANSIPEPEGSDSRPESPVRRLTGSADTSTLIVTSFMTTVPIGKGVSEETTVDGVTGVGEGVETGPVGTVVSGPIVSDSEDPLQAAMKTSSAAIRELANTRSQARSTTVTPFPPRSGVSGRNDVAREWSRRSSRTAVRRAPVP